MQKKNIYTLLTRFFENDFPKEVQNRFAAWFIRKEQEAEKKEILEDIWNSLPLTTDLTSLNELKRVNKRIHSDSRFSLRWVAVIAAAILLPLLGGVTTLHIMETKLNKDSQMVECFVPYGERRFLTLSDGSTVWLNAGSLLLYPKSFGENRTLYLSGEGNFTVARDEEKPFIVKTNFLVVEALGTVFNVRSYPDEEETTTVLESGKVKVDDNAGVPGSFILLPNEQLVYNHTDSSFTKHIVDASRLNTWTEGFLIFQKETLGNIFRSLERKYNIRISYNDSKFSRMTYTVRFHAEDTLEDALEILKQIGVDFKYKIEDSNVYIR